jgi:hypothetical protein
MAKSFSAKFNKAGIDLYNITLQAILNIGYKIKSENNKKLIIYGKSSFSFKTMGQDLEIKIIGSKINLKTSSGQATDWGEGEEISKKLFEEIKKLSTKIQKIKPLKKEKIEQSKIEAKKSSQKTTLWVTISIVGGILLILIGASFTGGSGGVSCQLLNSKEYNNKVISCKYKCYKEGKSKIFNYTPIPDSPPFCPGFPQYWSNDGRYKNVEGDFIFKN